MTTGRTLRTGRDGAGATPQAETNGELRAGDIIVAVDGRPCVSTEGLDHLAVSSRGPREGQAHTLAETDTDTDTDTDKGIDTDPGHSSPCGLTGQRLPGGQSAPGRTGSRRRGGKWQGWVGLAKLGGGSGSVRAWSDHTDGGKLRPQAAALHSELCGNSLGAPCCLGIYLTFQICFVVGGATRSE